MINRYQVDEIEFIWSDDNKYSTWLEVEKAICEGWEKMGVIPKNDLDKILSNSKVDLKRMLEIEQETRHDVVAFTRMLSEQLGSESKWIHLGITSTDVVDTAQNILISKSISKVENEIFKLKNILKDLAFKNKDILIMGRTHGVHGEPTSLGLKFALWFNELTNQEERLELAKKQICVAKVSGSMGNCANLETEIEEFVANKFSLNLDLISTQVTQRDRHLNLISVLVNIASTLEKIATEIRLFQQTEINEICEGFNKGQKGSSSMPHKKNPISSENICGLSRYVKSLAFVAMDNNNLWHERDISHSSNERIMFPDIFNVLVYILKRTISVMENIHINYDEIKKHILTSNNIYFSQRVLTYLLINTKDFSREEIYDFIQKCSFECSQTGVDFKDVLMQRGVSKYLSNNDELESLFDDNYFLRNTEKIFNRLFK